MRAWLRPVRAKTLLLLSAIAPLRVTASPAVNVALQASFSSAPYLVELLETAAEENSTAYFPLLDRIADGYFDKAATDYELYTSFVQLLHDDGHITDPDTLSSFEFALSIHSAAPRIEAHYQYYNTSVEQALDAVQDNTCESWMAFGGKQYCSPELDSAQGSLKSHRTDDLPFDRILGDSTGALSSVLYADITSPSFGRFHKTVSRSAKEGKTSYRIRYKHSASGSNEPLVINGYGVELALKRTDYIVIDDREAEQAGTREAPKPAGGTLQDEDVSDLKPLSASELSGLGLKTASFVLDTEEPLDTLLKLSQDFPKHSSAIAAHNLTSEFLAEHSNNAELALPPGYNVFWINGVQVDPRKIDAFSLLDHLRRERRLINGLQGLGFSGPEAISVLSHTAIAEAQAEDEPQRYDYRDGPEGGNVIMWLNDIEKDKRYEAWPTSITALLQRTYPGQLPPVRRDIHNAIVPVDFSNPKDVSTVVETLQNIVRRNIPIRWGLVPYTGSTAAAQQARVAYHLLDAYGLSALMTYLENSSANKKLSAPHQATYDSVATDRRLRKDHVSRSLQEVLQEESLDDRLQGAKKYLMRLGAYGDNAPVFVNGAAIPRSEEWLQTLSQRVGLDLRRIQKGVFEDEFTETTWLPAHFLAYASLRRNPLIIPEDEKNITLLNLEEFISEHGDVFSNCPRIAVAEGSDKDQRATLMLVADFDSIAGQQLWVEAINFRKQHNNVELIFIHNGQASSEVLDTSARLYRFLEHGSSDSLESLEHVLASEVSSEDTKKAARFWTSVQPLVRAMKLKPGESGLLLNGRLIAPIPGDNLFTADDLETLLAYESKKRVQPVFTAVEALGLEDRLSSPLAAAMLSSIVALSTVSDVPEGIFETAPTHRSDIFNTWSAEHTAITTGDQATAAIQVTVSLDPASEVAQRWVPILKVLSELSGVYLRLFLNPKERLDELPIKRFYRYVLDSKPSFDENGALQGLKARFTGLPEEALLTMAMDVPAPWLVTPKECVHDLDNIKLSTLRDSSDIDATYELENILIEGHSRDITQGIPPRGTQLVLGTEKDPHFADTIIMANLGYFQFKANPGFYKLGLQAGRSTEIFTIDSAGTKGYNAQPGDETTEIALMSFQGVTLYPRLSRKPGKEDEDVLEPPKSAAADIASKSTELKDKVLSKLGLSGTKTEKAIANGLKRVSGLLSKTVLPTHVATRSAHADINIFSVASGHLYERMLNIMMVSVMKHTKHSVKFWFIEQFLSPSFKAFLPHLAASYGFQYEMVTYKWPHWLRGQKEKQREIWGYKILFLDVLFPLNLDKVIFVDADQVVRTDMYELVNLDLHGAPYGFTPMCDSRTEMEGFRFWKQGYWANFLRGRPYHISALYVVDLRRFRQIAAGDRLRQNYHQLSADPHSLSNLDQDLPNHMQHVLPIYSLPQEWLWCETWCADEELSKARTIDLCNNPLTKEPKLERARRQLPEWTEYDEEIAELARRVRDGDGVGGRAPVAEGRDERGSETGYEEDDEGEGEVVRISVPPSGAGQSRVVDEL
ncbi:killer toxin resistant protein [Coniosporium apollinis]|uniref:Killer toxin resistant protein n=1 Tax=Coniosporium apollinis TaxID=61459 RepID=A0ABQ9NYJ6_9PEZI|nr:killer toxin resistant protein [Coniosporium apollinis]